MNRRRILAAMGAVIGYLFGGCVATAGPNQVGKCKRKGCKCPGFDGGYVCSNCKHSNVDHI